MIDRMTAPAPDPSVSEGLRGMMRGFPTGVAVVTATDAGGTPWGMTCSSVCSATLHPPTLLVCLRAAGPTLAAVLARGRFAVNLLHAGGRATAELFASGAPDRFGKVAWREDTDASGPHLWQDAHAVADCTVRMSQPVGDHVAVFGEVLRVTRQGDCRPLMYGLRTYSPWPGTETGA
ncbi:flavin reductase family protein [Streptomyces sp. NPDC001502]|uniref:flavin reductase family protein n=1 Tax=Streptomyces sp. NPDC001502 TaxID=3364578 RepID=UPI0036BD6723